MRVVGRDGEHSGQVTAAFLEAAHSHANEREHHALEVVQRLRIYSENYVEPAHHLKMREMPLQGTIQEFRPAFWAGPAASTEGPRKNAGLHGIIILNRIRRLWTTNRSHSRQVVT